MSDSVTSPPSMAYKSVTDIIEGLNSRELILTVKKMNPGQKKLLAVKGNAAIRKILLRDPNHEVQMAIINSPKASESEVEQIAKLASSAEIVLRSIFSHSRWNKSYRIKLGLARNPKTPINIVQRCLFTLVKHDLKKVAQDPTLRKPVSQAAERLLKTRK